MPHSIDIHDVSKILIRNGFSDGQNGSIKRLELFDEKGHKIFDIATYGREPIPVQIGIETLREEC